jgi:hypothetical protein
MAFVLKFAVAFGLVPITSEPLNIWYFFTVATEIETYLHIMSGVLYISRQLQTWLSCETVGLYSTTLL